MKRREGARDEVEELEKHEKEQEEMEQNKRRRSMLIEPAYEEPLGIQRQQTLSKGTYGPIVGG